MGLRQHKKTDVTLGEKTPIQEAIVFIERSAIRAVVRQELKAAGVPTIYNIEELSACLEHLTLYPKAMLVLDWDHGDRSLNQILTKAQGAFSCDTRPIFLIASEISLPLVATATEYFVSRVHTGEISRSAIQSHLEVILADETDDQGFRIYLAQVAEARAKGDLNRAGKILSELMQKLPGNTRVGCELVEHHIDLENWSEAETLTDMLMAIDSNHLRIQHLKARILMHKGEFDEAAGILTRAKLINPFHVERLVDLGKAFLQSNRIQDALMQFDEAIHLDESHKGANLGRAQCRLIEGDVNEALMLLRQMSSPRELASVFNNAAIFAIRQSRFDHGFSLYRSAIATVGKEHRITARLLYNLGIAQYKAQKMDEALECFEAAFKYDHGFLFAKQNAISLAHKLGRKPIIQGQPQVTKVNEGFAEVFDEEQVSKAGR